MADGITTDVSGGGTADIETDQLASGKHVQITKLADGQADSTDRIRGTTANGLWVDPTRLPDVIPARDSVRLAGTPTVSYPVKTKAFKITASGSDEIAIAAVSTKSLRILSLILTADASTHVDLKSNSTLLVDDLSVYGQPLDLSPPLGEVCRTVAGEALKIQIDVACVLTGIAQYIEV